MFFILQEAFISVKADLQFSSNEHFKFGAKIVRGAYMDLVSKAKRQLSFIIPYDNFRK